MKNRRPPEHRSTQHEQKENDERDANTFRAGMKMGERSSEILAKRVLVLLRIAQGDLQVARTRKRRWKLLAIGLVVGNLLGIAYKLLTGG